MDKHKIPINFYIDLSKAFDGLRHDILLDKLTYYGVTNPSINVSLETIHHTGFTTDQLHGPHPLAREANVHVKYNFP